MGPFWTATDVAVLRQSHGAETPRLNAVHLGTFAGVDPLLDLVGLAWRPNRDTNVVVFECNAVTHDAPVLISQV